MGPEVQKCGKNQPSLKGLKKPPERRKAKKMQIRLQHFNGPQGLLHYFLVLGC